MSIRILTAAGVGFACLCLACAPAASGEASAPGPTDTAESDLAASRHQVARRIQEHYRTDPAELARQAFEAPGIVLSTPRLNVAGGDAELAQRVAAIVEDAIAKLPPELVDDDVRMRLNIGFPTAGKCPARARASARGGYGFIDVHLDRRWPETTLRRVLAHEVGHVYHLAGRERMQGPQGDALLVEGLATWLSRDAWLTDLGFPSFEDAVRTYLEDGAYVSLVGGYKPDIAAAVASQAECFALRDQLYTQWAAFVAYLLDRFGLGAVLAATEQPREVLAERAGVRQFAPLDYAVAFGVPLEELERDWLAGLGGR